MQIVSNYVVLWSKYSPTSSMTGVERSIMLDCFLCRTKVVDSCVEAHVCFEVDTISQMVHDLVNAILQEQPAVNIVVSSRQKAHPGLWARRHR